jgi:hypothetical protein
MKISLENLRSGIDWWQHSNWPSDFHNLDYFDFYQDRSHGLTDSWLEATVDRLAQWRAIRSPRKPNTKQDILASLRAMLDRLQAEYQCILDLSKAEPSVDTVSWQNINSLYSIAAQVKNGSAVFASKLCHFMFPKVFIVMDNLGTQVMIYDYYWQGMVNEWNLFPDKEVLTSLLRAEIVEHSTHPIHRDYPFETKIMELCHVGDKWR